MPRQFLTVTIRRQRVSRTDEAIPDYEAQLRKSVFERDWFSPSVGLRLCSLTAGDSHAGRTVMFKNL
jgi:hypothetical protein